MFFIIRSADRYQNQMQKFSAHFMVNDTLTPLSIEETLRKQDPYGVKGLKIG